MIFPRALDPISTTKVPNPVDRHRYRKEDGRKLRSGSLPRGTEPRRSSPLRESEFDELPLWAP
jgi:hypothetical protein